MPHNRQTHPGWRRDRNLYLKAKGNIIFPSLAWRLKLGQELLVAVSLPCSTRPAQIPRMECWLAPRWWAFKAGLSPRENRAGEHRAAPWRQRGLESRGVASSSTTGTENWYGKGSWWRRTAKSPREQLPGATCMDSATLGDTEPLPAAETDPWPSLTHCRHRCIKPHISFPVVVLSQTRHFFHLKLTIYSHHRLALQNFRRSSYFLFSVQNKGKAPTWLSF